MAVKLDHILWGAPDLDAGATLFESLTGVTPGMGGTHPGYGTRNHLAALDNGVYFEVIAPDPAQPLSGNRGGVLAALPHPGLYSFALNSDDLPAVHRSASAVGLTVADPIHMNRTRPDGVRLDWSILFLKDAALGEAIPFVIDWGKTPHPSSNTPPGCRLRSLVALQPDPTRLTAIYRALGVPVEVKRGARPGLVAVLDTPRGEVVLTSP